VGQWINRVTFWMGHVGHVSLYDMLTYDPIYESHAHTVVIGTKYGSKLVIT